MTSITFVEPSDLATILRLQQEHDSKPLTRILDVRDDDFAGGHIKGCIHIPCWDLLSPQPLPSKGTDASPVTALDMFIEQYCTTEETERIVCHCYFSQQRGPMVARRIAERLEQLQESGRFIQPGDVWVLKHGWRRFGRLYGAEDDLVEDIS
jgi:rhodanese-related sulfurtransferase